MKHGADLYMKADMGYTALIAAAVFKNPTSGKALIKADAKLDVQGK